MFCHVRYIQGQAEEIFGLLAVENLLNGLERDEFVDRAAFYMGEINALHPFREGNGRAQREFIRELALHAGYRIDYSQISESEMINASIDSFMREYAGMKELLNRAIIRM